MRRRFAADEVSKRLLNEEEESSSESPVEETKVDYNPSVLRPDAIPDYGGHVTTQSALEEESYDEESSSEAEIRDESDVAIPEPEGAKDLEKELAELEGNEGASLIDALREQQEADMRVAIGTSALQNQYRALLLLRLKMQAVLQAVNVLPPSGDPFEAALCPEVQELLGEISGKLKKIEEELHDMKTQLEKIYGWNEENVATNMMDIIQHWGLKTRLGTRHGSVINRPIEMQIATALEDKPSLIQPSRHRDEGSKIFGLEEQPEISESFYNDYNWYKKLLTEYVGEKKPDANIAVEKPQHKQMLKGRQIHYDVIPELQGFMVPSKPCVVSDQIDVLFNSLMK